MKTSTILAGIAMTLLLLALPAVASDFTLGVFGNANEDDKINMQDVTYTELIILEYRDETELSDAKYDGKINMQDVTQIELIILGKEKEITVLDSADRTVTVGKPVERVILYGATGSAEAIRVLKANDMIVGVPEHVKEAKIFFPELSSLPSVGMWNAADYEAMIELDPDFVIVYSFGCEEKIDKLTPAGITVVVLDYYDQKILTEEILRAGYLFNRVEEAETFNVFYESCINTIAEETDEISDEDKPRVYYEYSDYLTVNENTPDHSLIATAGGINIAAEKLGTGMYSDYPVVDPEWVIVENPDIMVKIEYEAVQGYEADDSTELAAVREAVLNRPGFDNTNSGMEKAVYIVSTELTHGHLTHFVHMAYLAKWFHPAVFEDLDPQAMHQEYLTEFQGLDYDLSEHGVFVYPPLEES